MLRYSLRGILRSKYRPLRGHRSACQEINLCTSLGRIFFWITCVGEDVTGPICSSTAASGTWRIILRELEAARATMDW